MIVNIKEGHIMTTYQQTINVDKLIEEAKDIIELLKKNNELLTKLQQEYLPKQKIFIEPKEKGPEPKFVPFKVTNNDPEPCYRCSGSGKIASSIVRYDYGERNCPVCEGTGYTKRITWLSSSPLA